jgi:hypothetical protein
MPLRSEKEGEEEREPSADTREREKERDVIASLMSSFTVALTDKHEVELLTLRSSVASTAVDRMQREEEEEEREGEGEG